MDTHLNRRGGSNEYVPMIYVLSKNVKNVIFFSIEIFNILQQKKSLYIAWASCRNVLSGRMFIVHVYGYRVCINNT